MSSYLKIIYNLPNGQDPIDFLISSVSNFFEANKKYTFLQNTKYSKYKEHLFNIIEIIYSDTTRFQAVKNLSRSIPAEESFETTQYALSLHNTIIYLHKNHKRLNAGTIRKYISAYRDLGVYMEKTVRILVAIQEILKA